ncbi:MAG: quinone-dependent dihydroorotate dehydrogenase [Alphaproteobacteria bacterium]|nr:quinone-dependent dihydroorotate dehydrogenase [Alphaproteobacteria bacterium]
MIWPLAARLARQLPGEAAHRLAVKSLALGIGPRHKASGFHAAMATTVAGLHFDNPLGLAAGFDKNAEAIKGSLALGFGFTEVGTITPKGQPGNPKPRVFRLPSDGAVINRYGFNNDGMVSAAKRLAEYRHRPASSGVVGVNIGANKDSDDRVQDYRLTAETLAQYADYLTVNVSSPNTPGLRGLQEPEFLNDVLMAANTGMTAAGHIRPLMLKIAPDLDHDGVIAAIDVALQQGCAGIIISNTTISRPAALTHVHQNQAGGLSGRPLMGRSSQVLATARQHLIKTGADAELPIIAAGGVDSAERAYVKLLLGASLVQVYTGLALNGPTLPATILAGLAEWFDRDGVTSLEELRNSSLSYQEACRHCRIAAEY